MGDTVGGGTSNSGCQCPFQEVELHSQDPEQPGAGPGNSPPVLTTEGNWQPWQLQLLETLHPWFQFRVVSRLLPLPGEGPNATWSGRFVRCWEQDPPGAAAVCGALAAFVQVRTDRKH